MRRRSILLVLLLGSAPAGAATFQGLGYLSPGIGSSATGVSADGTVVVGSANNTMGGEQGFRWTNGVMTGLGYLGGNVSSAYAVDASGAKVVGHANGAMNVNYSWVWSSGTMSPVDSSACGGQGPFARGISGDGAVIVGDNDTDHMGMPINCFPGRPVEWTGGGPIFIFPTGMPGPPSGLARAANADGSVIVGQIGVNATPPCNPCTRAFRYTSAQTDILGDLGGYYSSAYAVTPDGSVVVGTAAVDNVVNQPFRWSAATGLVGLGGQSIGATAYAVNSTGSVVVGEAFGRAFRWSAGTGLEYVQDVLVATGVDMTGWNLRKATGVSADGTVIVGSGDSATGGQAWIATLAVPTALFSNGFE